jgi:hypothetical protein
MDGAVKEGAEVKEDEEDVTELCDNNLYGDMPGDNYGGSNDDDRDNNDHDNNDHGDDESGVKVDVAD